MKETVRSGIFFMFLFCFAIGIIAAICATVENGYKQIFLLFPIVLSLITPVAWFIFISPTLLFCIKLEDGYVKHVFLDRYVLSQYLIADFVEIKTCGWPQIRFTKKRRINLYGMHLGILAQLQKDIKAAKKMVSVFPQE